MNYNYYKQKPKKCNGYDESEYESENGWFEYWYNVGRIKAARMKDPYHRGIEVPNYAKEDQKS